MDRANQIESSQQIRFCAHRSLGVAFRWNKALIDLYGRLIAKRKARIMRADFPGSD